MMRKHYSRYTLDKVSSITGVSKENLLKVYEAYSATGVPDKAGTECYALGWTHHTTGSQNIRTMSIIQLLLGNMGIAGGGINALRGEPNVQGSTDHCILYGNLPGYLKMLPASLDTLEKYLHKYTPESKDPQSANYYSNYPKFFVSFLKSLWDDKATKENEFGYNWLPKMDDGKALFHDAHVRCDVCGQGEGILRHWRGSGRQHSEFQQSSQSAPKSGLAGG